MRRTQRFRPPRAPSACSFRVEAGIPLEVGYTLETDEREEHAERVTARPLTSLVAVVDAGSGALESRSPETARTSSAALTWSPTAGPATCRSTRPSTSCRYCATAVGGSCPDRPATAHHPATRDGALHRQLAADPPQSVAGGEVVIDPGPTDAHGHSRLSRSGPATPRAVILRITGDACAAPAPGLSRGAPGCRGSPRRALRGSGGRRGRAPSSHPTAPRRCDSRSRNQTSDRMARRHRAR